MLFLARRVVLFSCFACLFVLATALVSGAETIDLSWSTQHIHFRGNGKGTDTIDLFFGACNKQWDCTLSGKAKGPRPDRGTFTITMKGPIVLTDSGKYWLAAHGADSASFCYGPKCSLLAGTLVLLRFNNIGNGTFIFTFKATGGSLKRVFSNGHGDFTMRLTGKDRSLNLAPLLGKRKSISENFFGGILSSVPEPDSWALFGSGLLAVAGAVGRRLWS